MSGECLNGVNIDKKEERKSQYLLSTTLGERYTSVMRVGEGGVHIRTRTSLGDVRTWLNEN